MARGESSIVISSRDDADGLTVVHQRRSIRDNFVAAAHALDDRDHIPERGTRLDCAAVDSIFIALARHDEHTETFRSIRGRDDGFDRNDEGRERSFALPTSSVATIPDFRRPFGFGMVTSTWNVRLF